MTPYNAMMFALSFVALTASITHVGLYYASDLKKEFWVWGKNKEQRKYDKEMGLDIHVKMMQRYKDVPWWWYALVFGITIVISIVVCEGKATITMEQTYFWCANRGFGLFIVYPIHLPWVRKHCSS